ncbi:hypothetical protein CPB86DRAFT_829015 [Serendipita vermifera]|nr:hypothetical protein CPB86DRAFT_829015 [Serendipita vermifera]
MATSSTSFNSLPDELISEIVGHLCEVILPLEGKPPFNLYVWPISCCNKRLRLLTLPLVYHTIHISEIKGLDKALHIIIDNPAHAELVKKIMVDWDNVSCGEEAEQSGTEISTALRDKCVEKAKQNDLPDVFIAKLHERQPWAYILLLLCWTPFLEAVCINMKSESDDQEHFKVHLSEFLTRKLVSPKLKSFIHDSHIAFDVALLIPVFLHPIMTEIQVNRAESWLMPSQQQFYAQSNVQKLSFYFSDVEVEHLAELLRLPHALKCFIYHGGGGDLEDDEEEHALESFKEALDHLAGTLEHLNMEWMGEEIFEDSSKIWSFQNFTHLKSLQINYVLVYGEDPKTAPCIADSLPESLEVLAILFQGMEKALVQEILDMLG